MQFDVTIVNNVSILQYMMLDVTAKYQKDYMHSCQRLAWWLGQLFFVLTAKTHYDRIRIETCNLPPRVGKKTQELPHSCGMMNITDERFCFGVCCLLACACLLVCLARLILCTKFIFHTR